MVVSPAILIGIGVATMFFGYFFGLFEGRGQGYKKRKKEEADDPVIRTAMETQVPPPPLPPEAVPPPPPMLVVQAQPAEASLLRLSLDATQQPCLDLDGERIDTSNFAPEQRKRLIDLMVMMRPWLEAGPVAKQAVAPPPTPTPARPQPAPRMAPIAEVASPSPTRPAPRSVPKPVAHPVPVPPIPVVEPAPAPTTMVGQIDAILQTRLIGTPLEDRGIRLVEAPEGAMVVVGSQSYAGVGEVPDEDVKAIIRAAIAEWERRYTPG